MNFLRSSNGVYELDKAPVEPLARGRGLPYVLLLIVLSIAWTAFFAWFVSRSVGWAFVNQLVAHEIGGIVAGFIAPPAAFFALMSMFTNNLRTRETVVRLEAQVARLATPQAEAEAGLVDLGEEMRGYAATLEHTVDHSRAQLDQLGTEFTERVDALSTAADTSVESSAAAGRTLSLHAQELSKTLREALATLEEIRAASPDFSPLGFLHFLPKPQG